MESRESLLEHRPAQSLVNRPAANPPETENRPPLAGPERRERVRVVSQLPLSVKYGGIYEVATEALNISARGMFFALQQRLDIGATVELVFRLPRRVIGVMASGCAARRRWRG